MCSDEELWESLVEEGQPVEGDETVFRWRGKVLLHPFWSKVRDLHHHFYFFFFCFRTAA